MGKEPGKVRLVYPESIDRALKELNSGFELPNFEATDTRIMKDRQSSVIDLRMMGSDQQSMHAESEISYKYGS